MKRKSLLFILLIALLAPLAVNGQETLVVANATGTHARIPFYGLFADDSYQHTQTIYPSTMLTNMQGGQITKLTYHLNGTVTQTFGSTFQVRIGTTNQTSFSNSSSISYLSDASTLVYSNTLSLNNSGTVEFTFNQPYTYNGGNLIVDVRITALGSGYKSMTFYGESGETYYSVQNYSESSVPTTGAGVSFMPKTTFTYTPSGGGQGDSCDYSEDFENVSGASSGYSVAGSLPTGWDQIYTGTVNSTSAYAPHVHNGSSYPGPGTGTNALSGYYLGFYGTGNNSNSYAIMPALPANEAASHISFKYRYESTSYGTITYGVIDGTDASTYEVLGTCSKSSQNGLVDVDLNTSQTAGKRLAFRWSYSASSWYTAGIDDICVMTSTTTPTYTIAASANPAAYGSVSGAGSYQQGTSCTLTATANQGYVFDNWTENGSVVSGAGATYTFTVTSSRTLVANFSLSCPAPTPGNVTDLMPTSATLNWTGDADGYYVRYRTAAYEEVTFFEDFEDPNQLTEWISIDDDGDGYGWQLASMTTHSGDYALASASYINNVGSLHPDNWLITPQLDLQGTMKVWLSAYDGTYYNEHFAIYLSTTGNSISDFTTTLVAETTTINQYVEKTADLSAYAGQKGYIAIRHFNCTNQYWINVDDFGIYVSHEAGQWLPNTTGAHTDDNSLDLTSLIPERDYEWQVMADCGTDGESGWSAMATFTTPDACAAPFDPNTTDITANSAKLNWTGYQDEYNVSYGKVLFYEDFEDGDLAQAGWTVYTLGESPNTNGWYAYDASSNWTNHNGNYSASAWSWASSAYNANNWLVSPQVTLNGTLSFWVYGNYEDEYEVLLSTNGYTTSDFNVTLQAMTAAPKSWTEINIDLSSYNGAQGYIAIHHVFNDGNVLLVDDFGIYDLQSTTSTENNVTVSVQPESEYIWKVQGDDCDGNGGTTDWSEYVFFTTTNQFVKHIIGYNSEEGNGSGNYYLIASPLVGNVAPTAVTNMVNSNHTGYDLFYFDQAQDLEWITYKPSGTVHPGFNLEPGKGYLYANSQTVDLVFNGSNGNYVTNGEETISLDYVATAPNNGTYNIDLPGWNLVGNPFAVIAYPNRSFYTMDSDGSAFVPVSSASASIEAMEGIFVEATGTGQSVTFSTTEPNNAKSPTLALNLINTTTGSSHVIDRAIVRFDQGDQLHKFQLFKNSTKVYIPKEGQDYAIVCSEEIGEMPVNFKAEDNGTYTLNLSVENVEFGYLHLIDNKTGMDIDLLQTPSYTFEAKTTDYESRFKLVFATGDNSKDDNFAYFSNGSFVINNDGKATLQVIDIMGRILKSENINGCANLNVNAAPGVYMLRLVNGDNVKVQKVVVK